MDFITKPVLTVDIVDFSLRSPPEQMDAIQVLIELLHIAIPEKHNHPSGRVWSPAGDGGAITFWDSIPAAVETTLALGKLIKRYNAGNFVDKNDRKWPKPARQFALRMGLHSGPVLKEIDFDDRENVWGDGVNISARVVSLARPDQILASEDFYKIHTWSGLEVTRIGKWWAKHQMPIVLYNIYSKTDDVGIPYSEVEEWFGPFHYPLEQAISTYEAMAQEEVASGKAFRAAVLAKRLLDLNPRHEPARKIIESISSQRRRFRGGVGQTGLYDDFFSPLSPDALVHFFQSAEFRVFDKGATIVEQGEKADSMMIVVSGQIYPFIGGERIRGRDRDSVSEIDVVFREGAVIGEMGLFNPGERRTATLEASKRSITLSVDYRFLKPVEGSLNSAENKKRREIQEQIWRYYCDRTAANQISNHGLLESLSRDEREMLLDNHQFLPSQFQDPIELTIEDLWNSWIIVVAGSLTVYANHGQRELCIEYKPGDLLGPIRLGLGEESPYHKVEVSPSTHLIRFPWSIVQQLIKKSRRFREDCAGKSIDEKIRLELI